jgi:hypothetical protein
MNTVTQKNNKINNIQFNNNNNIELKHKFKKLNVSNKNNDINSSNN